MIIRVARLEDSPAILALRNDMESVFWSGSGVTPAEHAEWFSHERPNILVLADADESVAGYVRVTVWRGIGRVSFAVDSKVRGHGYGTWLLKNLEDYIKSEQCPIHELRAEVHPGNVASLRAFMLAGYRLGDMEGRYQIVYKMVLP